MSFCSFCGKPISNKYSLRHGMGPVCYAKHLAYQDAVRGMAAGEREKAVRFEEAKSA